MAEHVTITISVGPTAAAVVPASGEAGGEAMAAPQPPLSLEALQGTVAATTPAPKPPEELARAGIGAEEGPPPMPIDQLRTAAGALTGDFGAPPPQIQEPTGASAEAPGPRPLEDLGAPGTGESGSDKGGRSQGRP